MQLKLFDDIETIPKFPSTRYQGSKLKFVDWIWECIKEIPFNSVLDAFGGTSCVSYKMKQEGKQVTYNDILTFNSIIGKALIENDSYILNPYDINSIVSRHTGMDYPHFIEDTFPDIYYTQEENQWLDVVTTNIRNIENEYQQAIAYFSLFQSCIIKRPYNLFHRKNLYIRTQDVERSFGNKVTWDTPFEEHFRSFAEEANQAVFSNNKKNKALNKNIFDISAVYDLVYIDTPYISANGTGVDYADFYHFLEGLVCYPKWDSLIDNKSKHKRLLRKPSEWTNPNEIKEAFSRLFQQFKDSILVISYRSDGTPSIQEILSLLKDNNKKTQIYESNTIKYVLSKKQSTEILIIAY